MRGSDLLSKWQKLGRSALGRRAFGAALGFVVPYTGSIRPDVRVLEPGHAEVRMRDRWAVRNHLRSVHAIALVNLGEVTSGLALLAGLSDDTRGIVKGLSIEYRKKARGTLVATCRCAPPPDNAVRDVTVEAAITDGDGDTVAVVRVDWRLGPVPATGGGAA